MAGETVLVVGSGGREHALALAMADSASVARVLVAPGNPGMDRSRDKIRSVPDVGWKESKKLGDLAVERSAFVVVGPEDPLAAGKADEWRNQGLVVFGPSAEASQLEASKSFAVEIMREGNIPYPRSYLHPTPREARETAKRNDPESYVIKEDGLAGGKGVYLPKDKQHATKIIEGLLKNKVDFLFQERLKLKDDNGARLEFSAFAICDGRDFLLLPFAQDHKALYDGDEGPNTGGMGAYAPIPLQTPKLTVQVAEDIVEPTLDVMRKRGTPFRGLLYVGGAVTEQDSSAVVEYNVRFGDPETQVVLPHLSVYARGQGVDVHEILRSAATGKLIRTGLVAPVTDLATVTLCMAAEGYPENPVKGDVIHGLDKQYQDVIPHYAGVAENEAGELVTAGGRVLYLSGEGSDTPSARNAAYAAIGQPNGVHFRGSQARSDIAEGIA